MNTDSFLTASFLIYMGILAIYFIARFSKSKREEYERSNNVEVKKKKITLEEKLKLKDKKKLLVLIYIVIVGVCIYAIYYICSYIYTYSIIHSIIIALMAFIIPVFIKKLWNMVVEYEPKKNTNPNQKPVISEAYKKTLERQKKQEQQEKERKALMQKIEEERKLRQKEEGIIGEYNLISGNIVLYSDHIDLYTGFTRNRKNSIDYIDIISVNSSNGGFASTAFLQINTPGTPYSISALATGREYGFNEAAEEIRKGVRKAKANTNNGSISAADEILKLKQLADNGIITQSEFEAKKKQLLGI